MSRYMSVRWTMRAIAPHATQREHGPIVDRRSCPSRVRARPCGCARRVARGASHICCIGACAVAVRASDSDVCVAFTAAAEYSAVPMDVHSVDQKAAQKACKSVETTELLWAAH